MSPCETGNGTGTPPMIPWRTDVYFLDSISIQKEKNDNDKYDFQLQALQKHLKNCISCA